MKWKMDLLMITNVKQTPHITYKKANYAFTESLPFNEYLTQSFNQNKAENTRKPLYYIN